MAWPKRRHHHGVKGEQSKGAATRPPIPKSMNPITFGDVKDAIPEVHRESPQATPTKSHLEALGGVPRDIADPVAFAEDYLDKHIPEAAMEKIWQLKFGSDERRNAVASELLARRNIVNRREANAQVNAVINLIQSPSPFAKRVEVVDSSQKQLPESASSKDNKDA